MALQVYPSLYDLNGSLTDIRAAYDLSGLQFGYKLNGGCNTANFQLRGNILRRPDWLRGTPTAVELVIRDAAGADLWRGRLLEVAVSPEQQLIQPTYVGYWAQTASQLMTVTRNAGTPTTLKNIVRLAAGYPSGHNYMPLLTYDDSLIGDPAVDFTPGGGVNLVMDHEYPRNLFQRLLQVGDGTNQWHAAVWADKKLRVFARNLTLSWQVWTDMMASASAHTMSRQNLYGTTFYPYKVLLTDTTPTWGAYHGDGLGSNAGSDSAASDSTAYAILGEVREAKINNPLVAQSTGSFAATVFGNDHKSIHDQGQGFTIGPDIFNAYGQKISSLNIRPGDVIRVVDYAVADLNLTGSVDNIGSYFIIECSFDVDSGTCSIVPDNPNPHIGNLIGSGL